MSWRQRPFWNWLFCPWVRGTEYKSASEAAFIVKDFTRVFQFLRTTASWPHHKSHSIRVLYLPEICRQMSKGKDIPWDTWVIPHRLPCYSNQMMVIKLCVFGANLEVLQYWAVPLTLQRVKMSKMFIKSLIIVTCPIPPSNKISQVSKTFTFCYLCHSRSLRCSILITLEESKCSPSF